MFSFSFPFFLPLTITEQWTQTKHREDKRACRTRLHTYACAHPRVSDMSSIEYHIRPCIVSICVTCQARSSGDSLRFPGGLKQHAEGSKLKTHTVLVCLELHIKRSTLSHCQEVSISKTVQDTHQQPAGSVHGKVYSKTFLLVLQLAFMNILLNAALNPRWQSGRLRS